MSSRGVRLPVETDRVVRVGRAHVIVIHMLRLGKREWGRLIEASEHICAHISPAGTSLSRWSARSIAVCTCQLKVARTRGEYQMAKETQVVGWRQRVWAR